MIRKANLLCVSGIFKIALRSTGLGFAGEPKTLKIDNNLKELLVEVSYPALWGFTSLTFNLEAKANQTTVRK